MNEFYKHDLMMLPRYTSKCIKLFTFKAASIMHVTAETVLMPMNKQWVRFCNWTRAGRGGEGHFPAPSALCQWRHSLVWDLLRFYKVQRGPKTMEPAAKLALTKPAAHYTTHKHRNLTYSALSDLWQIQAEDMCSLSFVHKIQLTV